jgi:hypothetical protein
MTGLAQVYWTPSEGAEAGSRYGNGPYRQYSAAAEADLFEHLVGTLKSLREAAEERNWKINWDTINLRFSQALTVADDKQFSEAVRLQSEVIIDLLAQIRRQRDQPPSDSAIDL